MAMTPFISEAEEESMGIDASSAIIKDMTIWNGDMRESSELPIMRTESRTVQYNIKVRIATISIKVPPEKSTFVIVYSKRI
jgi:hypothetical protein